ncbi:ARM repeat superfamily protein [Perilla frutescens var. hirtella]|uniref:ARM repeat superfamily protein n=1 Tax=Perilla frutescens var. hirtella TaxID=608512 RepID=A0AAD4JN10_PERFH|nr:ARM repeat superfamily protein [Perilla frutescens var. hirtella]
MPPATVPPPQSPEAPPSPAQTLHQISQLLADLLPSTLAVASFASRWQVLRSKLAALQTLIAEISDSSHWSENPLLPPLLPALLSTIRRIETLCHHCRDAASGRGKLLMQSDLDMAAGWLSKQINDLELLLRSGVLHHSTAIVLCRPNSASSKEELTFFVRDLFARLQIGGLEFKLKALDSLIQLLIEDSKSASIVAKEGDMRCLVSLLDLSGNDSVRELAVHAVTLLLSAGDSPRKSVFEEGALGPLLRIIEYSSVQMKEKAAMAVEFITADHDNAWAISAYGGVPILIELCKSGSLIAQSHAVGAIRNVSVVEDIQVALAEEGTVPLLIELLISGNASAQGKAANCISILASTSEHFRNLLLQEKGLQRLVHLFHECPVADTVEHVLRAIYSLSASESSNRVLSGSTMFIVQLADLIKHGKNIRLQHLAALLLSRLSISDSNKTVIAGCMGSLVRLMEAVKPDGIQEVTAKALVVLLTVKSNRKELVRDEKSLMRLAQMLDPRYEAVSKKFPVSVVAAIMAGGSHGCRRRLVAAGVYGHLQRLVEMDVAGAKKALQRLSGNRLTSIFSRTWRD